MLEDQLAQASNQATRSRIRITVVLAGTIVVAALFLFGIVRIDLNLFRSETATITKDPPLLANTEAGSATIDVPVPANSSEQEPSASPPAPNLPNENNTDLRDEFKEKLNTYETLFAAKIDENRFGVWNQLAQDRIQAERQSALSAFAASEYTKAIEKISTATEQATTELEKRDTAYTAALNDAKAAYKADDFDAAVLKIEAALHLDPDATEAQDLKQQIETLPSVLTLVEQAAVARIENDLEKEKLLLEKILASAPGRTASRERLNAVTHEIKDTRFAAYVSSGFRRVEERNLKSAQENLKRAEQIDRSRAETKLLREQVATLKKELDVDALIKTGIEKSAADNWTIAFENFDKAVSIIPGNKDAIDGRNLALTILDLQSNAARHIAAENRMAAENVRSEVKALIEEAKTFASFSPTLAAQTFDLEASLKLYGNVVPVFIESDGLTEISVRGVGRVGVTAGRAISLKPGIYTFEGTRKGFRSKLVKIEVPAGSSKVTVEVICDEPI